MPESVAVAESAPAPQERVAEAGTESGAIVESGTDPANPPVFLINNFYVPNLKLF